MNSKIMLLIGIALVVVMGFAAALSSSPVKREKPPVQKELVHQIAKKTGEEAAS